MGSLNSKSIGYMYISSNTTNVFLDGVSKHNNLVIIHLKPKKKINFDNCNSNTVNISFNYQGSNININILGNNMTHVSENNKIYTKYSTYEDENMCLENNHYYYVRKGYIKKIVCIIKNNFI